MASEYTYNTVNGVIVASTDEIKTEVETEYKNTFGQSLDLSPSTPQGILISIETLARMAVIFNNVAVANQINPNLAGGVFLDAIMALTGSARSPATNTIVTATLTGVSGTVVPQYSQARDTAGNLFQTLDQVTITSGTASVTFEAIESGAILVPMNTLTQIVGGVIGWETVTNPAAEDSVGAEEQSDAAARLLRRQTIGAQGSGLAQAITGALYEINGVTLRFQENVTGGTLVINGVTMVGHSLYLCISGGTDDEIAQVLTNKKSGGCAYNNGASGNPVSVSYTNPYSLQVIDVLFDRPDVIPITVQVTIKADSSISNPSQVIKDAIVAYANGEIAGDPGLGVGVDVSCFELAGAINISSPGIFVTKVEASRDSDPLSTDTIDIAVFEKASITAGAISVILV